jgi:hypothetical protein
MFIQQSGSVSSDTEEKRMSEVNLAGITGYEIPANGEDDKDIGKYECTQDIRVFGEKGDKKYKDEKNECNEPSWNCQDITLEVF